MWQMNKFSTDEYYAHRIRSARYNSLTHLLKTVIFMKVWGIFDSIKTMTGVAYNFSKKGCLT